MLVVEVEQPKVMEDLLLLVLVELVVAAVVVYLQLLLQQTMDVMHLLTLVAEVVELLLIMALEELQLKVMVDQV